jgi:hypothetical protein
VGSGIGREAQKAMKSTGIQLSKRGQLAISREPGFIYKITRQVVLKINMTFIMVNETTTWTEGRDKM